MDQKYQMPKYNDIKHLSLTNIRVATSYQEGQRAVEFQTKSLYGSLLSNKWTFYLIIEGVNKSISEILQLEKNKFHNPTIDDIIRKAKECACEIKLSGVIANYFWLSNVRQDIPIVD